MAGLRTLVAAWVAGFLGVTGCAMPDDQAWPDELGTTSHELAGGTLTTNFAAVVFVFNEYAGVGCTGTVIGPRTVLTAGHCVNKSLTGTTINHAPVGDIEVYFDADARSFSGPMRKAASLKTHPDFGGGGLGDLAIIRLADDAPVVALPLATDAPVVGESIEVLGYGDSPAGPVNRRQVGQNAISSVAAATFRYPAGSAASCSGDSGGPSLALRDGKRVVAGVHSGSTSGTCGQGDSVDMRVDAYFDWIVAVAGGDVADPNQPGDSGGGSTGPIEPDDVGGCRAGGPAGVAETVLMLLALAGLAFRRRSGTRA